MSIVGLLVLLIVAGAALYFIPMDPTIRKLVVGIVVVLVLLWIVGFFFGFPWGTRTTRLG